MRLAILLGREHGGKLQVILESTDPDECRKAYMAIVANPGPAAEIQLWTNQSGCTKRKHFPAPTSTNTPTAQGTVRAPEGASAPSGPLGEATPNIQPAAPAPSENPSSVSGGATAPLGDDGDGPAITLPSDSASAKSKKAGS